MNDNPTCADVGGPEYPTVRVPKECPPDHVICPNCAHDFGATSQADQDRIKELEIALHAATRRASIKVVP